MNHPAAGPPIPTVSEPFRAEAVVDLAAIAHNTAALLSAIRQVSPDAKLMAVVKADGYGHGAVEVAVAALTAGADMLGVATPDEAMLLRAAGIRAAILAWLWLPDDRIEPVVAAGIQLGVSSSAQLAAVIAVRTAGPAMVHLKVDTGLGRNGAGPQEVAELIAAAAAAHRAGLIQLRGLMSHLADGEIRGHPSVEAQTREFTRLADLLTAEQIGPVERHLANTGAGLVNPATVFDLVRSGIGIYGVDPAPGDHRVHLRPAMTLRARVALTKRVSAGQGVSYGLTYRTSAATTLALVPVGYADGIPRAASNLAEVLLGGRRRTIAGRVAMDQFVVDCGDDPVAIGDEVVLFGPGEQGEPTAQDWAMMCGTIGYEIVTRIGPRVPRRYVGGPTLREGAA